MRINLSRIGGSLLVAAVNVALAAVAFTLFVFPRFTAIGGLLSLLIMLLLIVDLALVLRDLWGSGTRLRAVFAVVLWLPILFLFLMILQWEGPLYVAVEHYPPHFQVRGLSMFCGLGIYGPEQEDPEWFGDDIGLIWSIQHNSGPHPFEADFAYGGVPAGFVQQIPSEKHTPPPLDPNVNYKLAVNRCMGGPQYFTLQSPAITEYKSNPNVCWGNLKVPERNSTVWVRADCNTRQPLPMSDRAKERLKAYRERRIPFY
ncbi:MAG: hypothetical protein WAL89_02420 [Candidatus Sulfotelmatobacter sp.]